MEYNCIDIKQIDLENSFFHYTNIDNLKTIFKNGLEPRIGANSLYVEKTPKIFFTKGEKGILDLMDVWLKWLTAKKGMNQFTYRMGTFYLTLPFCIRIVPNTIAKRRLKHPKKRKQVYVEMKSILEKSVFLVLDLEENVDFSYHDIDEVKERYYASYLKLLYTKTSNFEDKRMELWNMHTYSNKSIEKEKIQLVFHDTAFKASLLLKYLIENNEDYVKENCDFLCEYYQYIYEEC